MKKMFQLLVFAVLLMVSAPTALAYSESSKLQEGADIVSIRSMALAAPEYTPTEGAPSYLDLIRWENEAAGDTKLHVVTYDYVAEELFHQIGQDIRQIDRRLAKQIYRSKVQSFAESYTVLTVVNGRKRFGTAFYFDVFKSGTNDLLYSYMILLDDNDLDNEKNYTMMLGKFYKNFGWEVEKQRKEQEKERRERERKAEREAEKTRK